MTDILFFVSPIGLGHASRDAAVANHLGDVRFVTGGAAARLLEGYGYVTADVYRPPAFDVRGGHLVGQTSWLFHYYRYYNRCKKVAATLIERHKPRLVVSDEDFAALVQAQKRQIKTVLITDILNSRFTSGIGGIIERRMNVSMKRIMEECNHVIMPDAGQDQGNIVHVGPIVRDMRHSREELRKRYGMHRPTVLVTVGGTRAGQFLLDAMEPVATQLRPHADVVVSGGPIHGNMVQDLHHMICAADVVVSLAGRSTMDESSVYGTHGVFIPISGHFEQEDNAMRAGYTHGDVYRLYDIILEKLKQPRRPQPTKGAITSAELIQNIHS